MSKSSWHWHWSKGLTSPSGNSLQSFILFAFRSYLLFSPTLLYSFHNSQEQNRFHALNNLPTALSLKTRVNLGIGHWNRKLQPLLLDSYLSLWPQGRHHISLWQTFSICKYYDNLNELDVKLELCVYLASWSLILSKAIAPVIFW